MYARGDLGRLAGGLGLEPRLEESESSILPLDDPPIFLKKKYLATLDGWGQGDFVVVLCNGVQHNIRKYT